MRIRQWLSAVALSICMICICASAIAGSIAGINVMSARQIEGEPKMYVELRVMDSSGVGISVRQEDYFSFSAMETNLPSTFVADGNFGHIIVVDTSRYYFESEEYITSKNIQDTVSVYLDGLKHNERIRFILADHNGTRDTGYMPLDDARDYVTQIKLNTVGGSVICSAITQAFQTAISPGENDPLFNSVFIVADPDMSNNTEHSYSLESAAQMVISSNTEFDVFIAMPRRESFLRVTNENRRSILENGFSAYQNFASKIHGRFVVLPQAESSIDTTPLYELLSKNFYTSNQYLVDYTALEEFLPRSPKIQTVEFIVGSDDGISRKFDFDVQVDLLPLIIRTPIPKGPTPTPAPTPVVHIGQEDAIAVKAIRALRNLNYLSSVNYDSFDNECFSAYVDFCERNDINARDGIYESEYNFLISETGVSVPIITPVPTPEPTPSPTPVPTIPPQGYNINDYDTQTSGGFIAKVQTILKSLNCYQTGTQANAGRLDQPTLDAINRYCSAYGWINNRADGVNREIVESILNNGEMLQPLADPTPEPTPSPTPAPTPTPMPTIPPQGYSINNSDSEFGGSYISQMQAILKSLNCYALNAEATAGRVDQVTLDAISTYCQAYGWSNKREDGVGKEIVEGILNNGASLKPLSEPKLSTKELILNYLTSELTIMQWTIPMYIPVSACIILILVIILILLLSRKGTKNRGHRELSAASETSPVSSSMDSSPVSAANTAKTNPSTDITSSDDSEISTVEPYHSKHVRLDVTYGGTHRQYDAKLSRTPYVIARYEEGTSADLPLDAADKSISRKSHAELVYQNGQICIHDKSKFGNTEVNGTRVCDLAKDGIGVAIQNGTVIKISEHRIIITW